MQVSHTLKKLSLAFFLERREETVEVIRQCVELFGTSISVVDSKLLPPMSSTVSPHRVVSVAMSTVQQERCHYPNRCSRREYHLHYHIELRPWQTNQYTQDKQSDDVIHLQQRCVCERVHDQRWTDIQWSTVRRRDRWRWRSRGWI